jgi:Flp pilus assembly protein TadB
MSRASNSISITTGVVIVYIVISQVSVAFNVVFLFLLVSQGLLIWMVVQILKDKRTSQKTFETHYYEDVD